MKSDLIKEFYRFYVEYLKQSKRYKAFCRELEAQGVDLWTWWPYDRVPWGEIDQVRKKQNQIVKRHACKDFYPYPLFYRFGNIFSDEYSFEDWWDRFGDEIRANQKPLPAVMKYSDIVKGVLRTTKKRFIRAHGREPTIDEFIQFHTEEIKRTEEALLYVHGLHYAPMKDIINDVKKLVGKSKRKRTDIKVGAAPSYLWPQNKITNRTLDYLKRYLAAYCLRQKGHSYSEITRLLLTPQMNLTISPEGYKQLIKSYLVSAQKIIHNAETCLFPGSY